MKIAFGSDIHLEFGTFLPTNKTESDVLVLAGDICPANRISKYGPFFEWAASEYKWVVYVPGNHEHYESDFFETTNILREHLRKYENVFVLDRTMVAIDGVTFYGGTLWTDYNKENAVTLIQAPSLMNDYSVIGRFDTTQAVRSHKHFLSSYDKCAQIYPNNKNVVVSHHAPCFLSVGERFKNDYHGNALFCSDLSEFILDRPEIKYWFHGHTHSQSDYMIGEHTRVLCNPRGYYPLENISSKYELKTVEI
jgi:Icc-related predicted phosphoesterase